MSDSPILPLEVWVRILHHLPVLDVVRFQQISSSFRKVVQESVTLQYKIECFLAGPVIDEPLGAPCSARQRLDKVRSWYQAWKRASWREVGDLPVPPSTTPTTCVSGPVIAQMASDPNEPSISFHALEADIRGARSSSWSLRDLGMFKAFAFDWYQDLLVLVDGVEGNNTAVIQLLTCTTGETHPAAARPAITVTVPVHSATPLFKLQVCGDLVALVYDYMGLLFEELWVFDWRQGRLLVQIGTDEERPAIPRRSAPHGYALLDSRHVLVLTTGTLPALAVLDCYKIPSGKRLFIDDVLQAPLVLELPRMLSGMLHDNLELLLTCRPDSPYALPAQIQNIVFRAAGPPLVVVCFFTTDEDDAPVLYDLLIPGWFILSQLTQPALHTHLTTPTRRLPWRTYSRQCRLYNCSGGRRSVQDSRYANCSIACVPHGAAPDGGRFDRLLQISHFSEPAAILRDADIQEPGGGEAEFALPVVYRITDVSDQSNSDVWEQPMLMGAPYLQTWTDIRLANVDQTFLVEDGVVVNDRVAGVRAFTF